MARSSLSTIHWRKRFPSSQTTQKQKPMSKYKSVYPSETALGQAFSAKAFSPKGDLFRSRHGSTATHTTIRTPTQFIARWEGNTLFKTRYAGDGQQPLWQAVNTHYYTTIYKVMTDVGEPSKKTLPYMWRIYQLAPLDTHKEMLQKQLDCAHKTFSRSKRARVHNQMYYYNCAVDLFNECIDFANVFQLMPPSKNDIPQDFDAFPVVVAFKLKADGKNFRDPVTLHPYYTSTLSPSQSVAA
jgi:hypothetical protein